METHPLARWRKSHKQTLNDLARAAGCAVSHLSQIESGKTNPSLKLIAKLKSITNGAIDASHFMPQESAPAAKSRVSVGAGKTSKVKFGNDLPLSFIAGPCQMESREHALEVASTLAKIAKKLKIGLIYKTSFDKANRTSAKAARGIGIEKAIPIFREITAKTGLPTLTDVHEAEQCAQLSGVVDVLQIPAFLCRQTDLLLAAAKTGCVVNVKKGQFLAPWDMKNVVTKLTGAGNRNVLVTERGASFGYNTLVSDMRALPILARTTGAPVIFDATHSVQQPGGKGTSSGGEREFVPVLARAAVAVGVAGVFIETHPDPDNAPSDGPNMVPLRNFEALARMLMTFDKLAKKITKAIPVSSKAP